MTPNLHILTLFPYTTLFRSTPLTDLKDREIQFRPEEYVKGTKSPHFVNAPPGLFFPGDKLSGFTIPKAGTGSDLNNLGPRSEEHTSELQSRQYLVCLLLLVK